MDLITFVMWCAFVVPAALVLLWIVGTLIGGSNEAKAAAYLADLYDDENR